jgi:hypothetical protein
MSGHASTRADSDFRVDVQAGRRLPVELLDVDLLDDLVAQEHLAKETSVGQIVLLVDRCGKQEQARRFWNGP